MTTTKSLNPAAFIVLALLGAFVIYSSYTSQVKAAGGFLPSTMATTSTPVVTATAALVFATSSPNCAARIIGTASSSIMITFTDKNGDVPSAAKGFAQAASTTVAYDSGLYGCGAVKIYSFATQQITVAETF